jgi:LysR family transcriptional regulator, benzoate and cis,cis-muconate-responsive activator of ben and cat genes
MNREGVTVDIRHLKYFVTVAREGNIGRAATRLHISQPPLTRQIQQLEQELGATLLTRSGKGVELTEAGAIFLEGSSNILSLLDQMTERTQCAAKGQLGRIDIGIFGSAVLDVIPELLLKFRRAYPGIKTVLHTMTKVEQIDALRQRRIAVGFNRLVAPLPDITIETVKMERVLAAINDRHPLASHQQIAFGALREEPLVLYPSGSRPNFMDYVMSLCHADGFYPQVVQEVSDAVTGVALVASGFGICLVPESTASLTIPGVVYRPFAKPHSPAVDLSCLYRAGDPSPTLNAFLTTVRQRRDAETA